MNINKDMRKLFFLSCAISAAAFTLGPAKANFFQRSLCMSSLTQDELKKLVGYKSVDDYVRSGMVVGLGN